MESPKFKKINLFQWSCCTGIMIGSGWLFGSWEATKIAGPGAIFHGSLGLGHWLHCLCYVMVPCSRNLAVSKYAQYSHGSLLASFFAWANWVSSCFDSH